MCSPATHHIRPPAMRALAGQTALTLEAYTAAYGNSWQRLFSSRGRAAPTETCGENLLGGRSQRPQVQGDQFLPLNPMCFPLYWVIRQKAQLTFEVLISPKTRSSYRGATSLHDSLRQREKGNPAHLTLEVMVPAGSGCEKSFHSFLTH